METIKTHKGIFDEKKKTARIMRNVFIVVAVVYVGLIIWSICRQNYVVALFDVVILLMDIGYVYWCNAIISDADLAISAIECERSRCNLLDAISRNHPWINVLDNLPEEDPDGKGYSVEVIGLFPDGQVSKCFCSIEEDIWFFEGIPCDKPTHWMPMPKA